MVKWLLILCGLPVMIISYYLRTKVFVMSLKPCIEQMGAFF